MKPGQTFKHKNGKTYKAQRGSCVSCAFVDEDDECGDAPMCISLGIKLEPLSFIEVNPQKLQQNETDEKRSD